MMNRRGVLGFLSKVGAVGVGAAVGAREAAAREFPRIFPRVRAEAGQVITAKMFNEIYERLEQLEEAVFRSPR